MGVFVPFLLFTIMLFSYLHSIWLSNVYYSTDSVKNDFSSGGNNMATMMGDVDSSSATNYRSSMSMSPLPENWYSSGRRQQEP
jgi:hypothetical protein